LSAAEIKSIYDNGSAGKGPASVPVTVKNVAPVLTAPADQSAYPGLAQPFNLGSFTDPGADSPWSVVVNWGDGSSDPLSGGAPNQSLQAAHAYAAPGVYTVTETVTDHDLASDSKTFQVYVGTVVRNTNDSGPGSLRDVLDLANAHPGADTITFAIPT